MPDKEGAEERTTKDVVTKRQKQFMNKEEYVQEMPDDVKNIMMKGLRKGAGEFSKGGDPKNIIKKGVKSTIKNVIKSKSVQNFLNNEYIPEEGYDVARDQGRVKPSKDKKDATTMPPSKEMEKTRKVNKGPSALERVKADIEKRYGKGAIMDVSKEELDLTKVAESFGGYVIDENVLDDIKKFGGRISSAIRTGIKGKKRTGKETRAEIKKDDPSATFTPKKTKAARDIEATGDVFGRSKTGDATVDIEVPKEGPGRRKVIKQIPQDQIGVAPGQKEPPVKRFKNQGQLDAYNRAKEFRKKDAGAKAKRIMQNKKVANVVDTGDSVAKRIGKGLEKAKTKVGTGFKTFRQTASSLPKAAKTATQNLAKTQAVKKVTSNLTKGGLKTATKTAGKKAAGLVAKKTIGRALGKGLAKQIPGIGQVISGGEAIMRFAKGDVVGGVLSAAEMIPGLGLAAGAANVARDIGRTRRAVKTIRKIKPLSKGMKIFPKTRVGRQITKLNRQARANPLTSVAAGGGATYVGSNVMDRKGKGKLPKVPRPKLDQGVVGRRTAG